MLLFTDDMAEKVVNPDEAEVVVVVAKEVMRRYRLMKF